MCEYLYTEGGLRFESGTGLVRLIIDGEARDLLVVRSGKGRSRLELGEITLRDLEEYVAAGSTVPVTFDANGVPITLALDPRKAMGDAGRTQISDLDAAIAGLSPQQVEALAALQLETLPYGTQNAKEARERLTWALGHTTTGAVSEDALRNIGGLLDQATTQMIVDSNPDLTSRIVFALARSTADPEMLTNVGPEARAVLAAAGYVTEDGKVPLFEIARLTDDDVEDLAASGAVFDRTHGALIGDVPLGTWLGTREAVFTDSGTPWSLETADVRDADGNRVKDASSLAPGTDVTITPRWARNSELRDLFTITEQVSTGSTEAGASTAQHLAAWRSQGGVQDVYSRLPMSTLRATVGSLSEAELSEALAWSSPRDFAALSNFATCQEHHDIVEVRTAHEMRGRWAFSLPNTEWDDAREGDTSLDLEKHSRDSIAERQTLHGTLQGKSERAAYLVRAMIRNPLDKKLQAEMEAFSSEISTVSERLHAAQRATEGVITRRGAWIDSVASAVHHDRELRDRVSSESSSVADAAALERTSLHEASTAIEFVRSSFHDALARVQRGDAEGARSSASRAVAALDQASASLTRSTQATVGVTEFMDFAAEHRRVLEREKELSAAREDLSTTYAAAGAQLTAAAVTVTVLAVGGSPLITAGAHALSLPFQVDRLRTLRRLRKSR
jgi:hypothetical protein